jgi:APA family basic amino acid/polyamine antiporter
MSAPSGAPEPQLRRVLKGHHLFALSFGTIVGTGWITALGIWLGLAGSFGSVVGFALGGGVMILIALCYAQLAIRYPRAGGEISYAYQMWGLRASFVTGWLMVLIYVTAISFQTVALSWMLEVLVSPGVRGSELYSVSGEPVYVNAAVLAAAVGLAIAWLNHRGAREIASVQSWLTFGKIAISLAFFACAAFAGQAVNLEPRWGAVSGEVSMAGLWAVFATAPFFLAGFDVVPLAMGEKSVDTTRRAVYVAIVGSLVAAVIYYALVVIAGASLLPREELLAADLPAIAAFERAFDSPLLAKLVLCAGLMGVFTCWNASVFAAGRVLYSMGESRMIPAWFGKLHPVFATPGRATLFATLAGLSLLPFGKAVIYPIVNASGSSLALVALIVCGGLLRLRLTGQSQQGGPAREESGARRAGGTVLLLAATIGAAFIVFMALRESWRSSRVGGIPLEWIIFVAWIGLGAVLWWGTRRSRNAISEADRRVRLLGTP